MSCAKYQYGNHEIFIARIVQACLKFPILSLDTQLVLPQSNSTLVLTTSRPTLCLANMRPELLTSLRAVVRPAGADPSSHCPLIVCCLTPGEPLDIDHRSCVQDTHSFFRPRISPFQILHAYLRVVAQANSALVKRLDRSVLIHFQHSLKDVEPPADR